MVKFSAAAYITQENITQYLLMTKLTSEEKRNNQI